MLWFSVIELWDRKLCGRTGKTTENNYCKNTYRAEDLLLLVCVYSDERTYVKARRTLQKGKNNDMNKS